MKLGKRREDDDAPETPDTPAADVADRPLSVTDSWTRPTAGEVAAARAPGAPMSANPEKPEARGDAPGSEPVVEGEAVELGSEERAAPAFEPPVPAPMPFPVAEETVSVVSPGGPDAAAPLGDAGAYASGHAPAPSWQEPVMELVNERPEIAVGAAFAGGVLAAMILRRLGN